MAGLGFLISGWILFYTDWFPVVGGLLGLGGVFAWAAFLSGLLTESRKKELQNDFERLVLGSQTTWKITAVIGARFVSIFSSFGSIVLDTSGDDPGRSLSISRTDAKGTATRDPEFLAPHGEQKVVIFSGWFGRPYTVNASGLPSVFTTVNPLRRTRLRFWLRPVLLIRLSPTLAADAAQGLFALVVKSGNRVIGFIDRDQYHGETVWVGCDSDVAIPSKVIGKWRIELNRMLRDFSPLTADREEETLSRWMAPLAVASRTPPQVRDVIYVALIAHDGREVSARRVQVRESRNQAIDIQEVYLTYPNFTAPERSRDQAAERMTAQDGN
jgi:hypothetical protein